jgi:hypothetical protein
VSDETDQSEQQADLATVLRARCFARALLYANGWLDFCDAVNELQHFAEASGLVAAIGQDAVQAIVAEMFAPTADELAIAPDAAQDDEEPEPEPERSKNAAESTVEALMHSLRERGVAALSDRGCLDRLADLSSTQVRDVITRLIALRPRYPSITDELIFKLGEQL